MTERVITNTASDITATIIRGDSCRVQLSQDFDVVFTSPPWPDFDNASNGYAKLQNRQWQSVCEAIARFCAQAHGINSVKGIIELSEQMSDTHRATFLTAIQNAGLQVPYKGQRNILGPISYHKGRKRSREWWIVTASPMNAEDVPSLEEAAKYVEQVIESGTSMGRLDASMKAWSKAAYTAAGRSRIERPKRFANLHVEAFFECFLEPGCTVLDPFAGTGTTLKFAMEYNINSIGIDISRAFAAGTAARVEHVVGRAARKTVRATQGHGKTGTVLNYVVDHKQAEVIDNNKKRELDRLTRAEFRAEFGIDPNQRKDIQVKYIDRKHVLYTGRKPAYLYQRPTKQEINA